MKILLVSPNVESLPDPVFPLGLAYIASSLKENGIQCQILDLCFVEDYEAAIRTTVDTFQPAFVAISMRNLDNVSHPNYISYLPWYRRIVELFRQYFSGKIIMGGSGFSLMPDKILAYLGADFGIVGEGERLLVRLLQQLQGTKDSIHVPQWHPQDYMFNDYQPEAVKNLDDLPFPDRSLFDSNIYLKWGGMGNIQTKRGCPFQCIYCTYPLLEGRAMRLRSPTLVAEEMENMLISGIDHFFVVDNAFNYPMTHASEICKEIIRRKLRVRWSCYANAGYVTAELVELLQEAGCTGLEFGIDSAHADMLANLGKCFTVEVVDQASSICRKAGISFCHSLLIGGPGETMETIRQTMDKVGEMFPTAVICMIGIRIFPRTELFDQAAKEGLINDDTNVLNPVFYISPAIAEEILPFIESFSKKNKSWIFPGLNVNINAEIQKKLRRLGIKGPLWEYMRVRQGVRKR
jgi:radical SAM superfamily enzyme YgiQ (UPF0313 family)